MDLQIAHSGPGDHHHGEVHTQTAEPGAHLTGGETLPRKEAGDVGFHADRLRIHTHKQVVHGGVGSHAQLQNALGIQINTLTEVGDDGGQGLLDDGILEILLTAIAALLDDAVDNVSAVADLTVTGGSLGKEVAAFKVNENCGNGVSNCSSTRK